MLLVNRGSMPTRQDTGNLRAVLRYSLDSEQPDIGLELAGLIWRFWQSADLLTEGRDWLERLLEQPSASPAARAGGLCAMAGLCYWLADYDRTLELYEEALAVYRSLGDRPNEAETLYGMSMTAGWIDELERAEELVVLLAG